MIGSLSKWLDIVRIDVEKEMEDDSEIEKTIKTSYYSYYFYNCSMFYWIHIYGGSIIF